MRAEGDRRDSGWLRPGLGFLVSLLVSRSGRSDPELEPGIREVRAPHHHEPGWWCGGGWGAGTRGGDGGKGRTPMRRERGVVAGASRGVAKGPATSGGGRARSEKRAPVGVHVEVEVGI